MYDNVAKLISRGELITDEYGNRVWANVEREVFVQPRGVYASEFYQASQLGLQPSLNLFIANRADYQGEKVLDYEGKHYTVIRVDWTAQRDGITLVCEERLRNDN